MGATAARHFCGEFRELVEVYVLKEMIDLSDFGEEGWHGVKIRMGCAVAVGEQKSDCLTGRNCIFGGLFMPQI